MDRCDDLLSVTSASGEAGAGARGVRRLQGLVLAWFMFADSLAMLYAASLAFGLAQGGIVPSYAIIIRTFFPAGQAGWRIGTALLESALDVVVEALLS